MEILPFLSVPTFCRLRSFSCSFFCPSSCLFLCLFSFFCLPSWSRGNVVGTMIRIRARRAGSRTQSGTMNIQVLQNVGTDCGANRAPQLLGIIVGLGDNSEKLNTYLHIVLSLRMCADLLPLSMHVFTMWKGAHLPLPSYLHFFLLVSNRVRLSSFMKNDIQL